MLMTKRTPLLLLVLVFAGLLTACASDALAPTEDAETPTVERPPTLRVASVNMLHGLDSEVNASTLLDRLDLVAEALLAENVDIVGLQESSISSYGGNVAEELARRLGFEFVYQRANPNLEAATQEENDTLALALDLEEGEAVLSRYPITDSEAIHLPRVSPVEDRVALRGTVMTPWGDIDVYVTHLTNQDDPEVKADQARAIVEWMAERPSELPALLMGDFNAREGSETIDIVAGLFVDVYRAVDTDGPGYTCCQDDVSVAEPDADLKRIDFMFMAPGGSFAGEVVDARVFLNAPFQLEDGSQLWATDHYGLIVELQLFP